MPRIKAVKGKSAIYHCMSRIVGGDFLLKDLEKEQFVRMMLRIARFLGIEVLDYVVMGNHYHQLIRIPERVELNDDQLVERISSYYGKDSARLAAFERARREDPGLAQKLRDGYMRRMGDISEFEKTLKQGFSFWYNKVHGRRGTLWEERFKSVLVEETVEVCTTLAVYIDLNPVRAEMVEDPACYRFCGYGAAAAGEWRARRGIMQATGINNWEAAAAAYRIRLLEKGCHSVKGKRGVVSRKLLLDTLKREGQISCADLLRLRVRYFTDGLVLGSELFVEEVFGRYRSHFGMRRMTGSRPIKELIDSPLSVIHEMRLQPIS